MAGRSHQGLIQSLRAAFLATLAALGGGYSGGCGSTPGERAGVEALNASERSALLALADALGVARDAVTRGDWPARLEVREGQLRRLELHEVGALPAGHLGRFEGLRTLTLRGPLADLSSLADARALTDLTLDGAQAADLSALSQLPALSTLSLSNVALTDLATLPSAESTPSLWGLELRGARLPSFAGLGSRPGLRRLRVWESGLTSLAGLEGAPGLTELGVRGNALTDMEALRGFASLRRVDARDNRIADPTPLATLAELSEARLEGNPVDPAAFAQLTDELRRRVRVDDGIAAQAAALAHPRAEGFRGTPIDTAPEIEGGTRSARTQITWSSDRVEGNGEIGTLRGAVVLKLAELDPTSVRDPRRRAGPVRMTVTPETGRVRLLLRGGAALAYVEAGPGETATLDGLLVGDTHYKGAYLVALDGRAGNVRWTVSPR